MAYEIFARKRSRMVSPAISFNSHGLIGFNKAATQQLKDEAVENVLILWDADNRKVAVRRIGKKDGRSYRIHYSKKGNGSSFSAKTFLDYIGFDYSETRSMAVSWNETEAMFEVDVPVECLKGERQERLLSIEENAKAGNFGQRKRG